MSHFQCALMLMFSLCLVSKCCYKAELTCRASLSMISLHHKTSYYYAPHLCFIPYSTPHMAPNHNPSSDQPRLRGDSGRLPLQFNPWLHSSQRGVRCLSRWRRRAALWATVLRPPPIQCHNISLFTGETKCSLFLFLFPECSCKICSISS